MGRHHSLGYTSTTLVPGSQSVTHSRIRNAYAVYESYTARRSPVPYSFLTPVEATDRQRRYLEPCAVGAAEVSLCNQPRSAEDGIPTSVAAAEAYRRALLPTKIRVRRAHPFASAYLSHCISLLPPRPAGLPSPPHGHPDLNTLERKLPLTD